MRELWPYLAVIGTVALVALLWGYPIKGVEKR
jgi:hypothetical protein